MNSPILVSIVIPVYNREKHIVECLQSVQQQTYVHWEAIIVDDGSTDNTLHVVNSFIEQDKRFVLVRRNRQPKGGSVCRNIGLEKAQGQFVIFFDSDDLMLPFCLEQRVKAAQEKDFDFGIFGLKGFKRFPEDFNGTTLDLASKSRFDFLRLFIEYATPWQTMCTFWKKETLTLLGGFDEQFPRLQDIELHTRALINKSLKAEFFPELPFDTYYCTDNGEHRNSDQYNKIAIKGRYLYFKMIISFLEQGVFKEEERYQVTKSLRKFCVLFYKRFLIAGVRRYKITHHRLLIIANKNNILNSVDVWLLKILAKLWLRKDKSKEFLPMKGLFYHLLK